jgi:PAS domain S-box-containing protein
MAIDGQLSAQGDVSRNDSTRVDLGSLICTHIEARLRPLVGVSNDRTECPLSEILGIPFSELRATVDAAVAKRKPFVSFQVAPKGAEAGPRRLRLSLVMSYDTEGAAKAILTAPFALGDSARRCDVCMLDVIDATVDMVVVVDEEGIVRWVNQAGADLYGYEKDELIGLPIELTMRPLDAPTTTEVEEYIRGGIARAVGTTREVVRYSRDGKPLVVEMSVGEVLLGGKRFYTGFARNITARKGLEAALQTSLGATRLEEEKTRMILETALDAVVTTDAKGIITGWNPRAVEILGWSADEAKGKPIFDLLFSETRRSLFVSQLHTFVKTGAVPLLRERIYTEVSTRSGKHLSVEMALTTIETGQGVVLNAFIQDVSARTAAEQASARAHHALQAMIAADPAVHIVFDRSGLILLQNPAAKEVLRRCGVGAAPNIWELPFDWDAAKVRQEMDEGWNARKPLRFNDVGLQTDEGKLLFTMWIQRIEVVDGTPNRFLLVGADITERKHLESQLAQAQKLESIGQLAAGIAHEINTPAQYVSDNVRFLMWAFEELSGLIAQMESGIAALDGTPQGQALAQAVTTWKQQRDAAYLAEQIPKALTQSLEGLTRVATIVRAMKDFSHPDVTGMSAADINHAVESTVSISRNEWKYVADLEMDLEPNLGSVVCCVGEINQVVLNLIVNAAHAVGDVVGDSGDKGKILVRTRALPDGQAEVSVSDTGTGIPEENQSKVFDPFFTTKAVGKGTGQGLAIAHSVVVQRHGGTIGLSSEPGYKTTFVIRLPAVPPSVSKEAA